MTLADRRKAHPHRALPLEALPASRQSREGLTRRCARNSLASEARVPRRVERSAESVGGSFCCSPTEADHSKSRVSVSLYRLGRPHNLLLLTLPSIPPSQTHWMCRYANANHESAKNHLVHRDPAVCCRCGEWSGCSEERSGAHGISGACEQLCHRQIDAAELCGMEPRPATFS